MSAIFALLLASALAPARPNGPAVWLSDSDYPAGAKRRREEGTISFSLLISPEGRISKCSVTQSSGFPELDDRTCTVITGRARFKPATDENGMATHALYNGRLTWLLPGRKGRLPGRSTAIPPADIELQVQRLPNGALEESVSIVTKVDPTGHIISCEPASQKEGPTKLVEIACAEAKAYYAFVQTDADGKSVTLIRSLRVTFKAVPK